MLFKAVLFSWISLVVIMNCEWLHLRIVCFVLKSILVIFKVSRIHKSIIFSRIISISKNNNQKILIGRVIVNKPIQIQKPIAFLKFAQRSCINRHTHTKIDKFTRGRYVQKSTVQRKFF